MINHIDRDRTLPHDAILTKPHILRVEDVTDHVQNMCETFFSSHAFVTIANLEQGLQELGYTLGSEPKLEYDLDSRSNMRFVKHVKASSIHSDQGQVLIGFDTYYKNYVLMHVSEYIKNAARPIIEIIGR